MFRAVTRQRKGASSSCDSQMHDGRPRRALKGAGGWKARFVEKSSLHVLLGWQGSSCVLFLVVRGRWTSLQIYGPLLGKQEETGDLSLHLLLLSWFQPQIILFPKGHILGSLSAALHMTPMKKGHVVCLSQIFSEPQIPFSPTFTHIRWFVLFVLYRILLYSSGYPWTHSYPSASASQGRDHRCVSPRSAGPLDLYQVKPCTRTRDRGLNKMKISQWSESVQHSVRTKIKECHIFSIPETLARLPGANLSWVH